VKHSDDLDRLLEEEGNSLAPVPESFREELWARTRARLPRRSRRRIVLAACAAAPLLATALTWLLVEPPATPALHLDEGEYRADGRDLEVRSRDVRVLLKGAVAVLAAGNDLAARTKNLFDKEIPVELRIPPAALSAATLFLFVSSGSARVETAGGTAAIGSCQAALADAAGVLWTSEPQGVERSDPGAAHGPAKPAAPSVVADPGRGPVASPQGAVPAPSGRWFSKSEIDFGVRFQEELARGTFEFTNPTGVDQKITNLLPSCGCAKVELVIGGKAVAVTKPFVGEVIVPPRVPCSLTVEMDLKGVVGEKEAEIRIQTTDPQEGLAALRIKATARPFFVMSPENVYLGEMLSSEQRTFRVSVSSPHAAEWNIVRHEDVPQGMKIEVAKEVADGRMAWAISGVYGPGLREGDSGGAVRFITDQEGRSFTLNVSAMVAGALRVSPGRFVSFGHVPHGTAKRIELELSTPLPGHKVGLDRVEFEGLTCVSAEDFVHETREVEDGRKLLLALTLKASAPRCSGRGKIRVHVKEPEVATREIMFNVFIR
jgi:hypothetical protein